MISWGVIAVSFAFVPSSPAGLQGVGFVFFDNARTFYPLRFIFGVAEAGAFPGIILYLTYWFTTDERARWFGRVQGFSSSIFSHWGFDLRIYSRHFRRLYKP
jgi:hypothetical protein